MAVKNLGRIRGYSAYEIAQKHGFVGNEIAWLESLKGVKGDQGEKGDPGQNSSAQEIDTSNFVTKQELLSITSQLEAFRQALENLNADIPEVETLRKLTQDDITLGHMNGDDSSKNGTVTVSNGTLTISGGGGVCAWMLPSDITHFEGTFTTWNSALGSFIPILAKSENREEGLFIPKLNNFQKYISNAGLVQNGTVYGQYQTSYSGAKVGAKLEMDIIGTTVKVTLGGQVMYENDISSQGLFDNSECRTPALGFACSWSNKGTDWVLEDCKIS